MADEVSFEGKQYISSKRAAQLSGYAQDYVGQLARASLIDARRIGGLWYVLLDSLNAYKSKAESYKPELPKGAQQAPEAESVISFDGKEYVSASRAAKTSGYHQDYVGQLARSGKIFSRQIGNRWYVDHEALTAHKEEKDALLGAVQSQSVGIPVPDRSPIETVSETEPFFTYTNDTRDLLPTTPSSIIIDEGVLGPQHDSPYKKEYDPQRHSVAIRVVESTKNKMALGSKLSFTAPLALALTIVIVVTVGFVSLKNSSIYAINRGDLSKKISEMASTGTVGNVLGRFAESIEKLFASEITYTRSK
mgnify:CR=1 FL=1